MPAYSARRRSTWVLALGLAGLIVGADFWIARTLRVRAQEEFDAVLLARANTLRALTENEAGRIQLDYGPGRLPEFERADAPEHFELWLDDGRVLYRSPRLTADLPVEPCRLDTPLLRDVELPDGSPGRLLQVAYVPQATQDPDEAAVPAIAPSGEMCPSLVLVVARSRAPLDAILASTQWTIFGIGGLAIVLAGLLVWRVLARGFRPIDAMAAQVAELDAERLGTRLPADAVPREVAPIVEQLNALLARLEDSFLRERRFAGNVAHELRTPIAELRSLAQVGARCADDPDSLHAFFGDVGDIAGRMGGVVTNLMLLARCQAGVEPAAHAGVDLETAVAGVWSRLRGAAAQRGLRWRLDVDREVVADADPGKLESVLTNLLDNAVSYALPGTEVACRVSSNGFRFELEVSNAAAPLSAEELERLAEPFWRRDAARAGDSHAGLGLSLARALAELQGMQLELRQRADGVFHALLTGRLAAGAVRAARRQARPYPGSRSAS
ncbi:MAG: sensor histidine kinase N-terminal domain-containing protein [Planctomycetes bacterium]|nr:sensor histidine kinase N-terminal domain-containing protein [Planctomycetota bacterium]